MYEKRKLFDALAFSDIGKVVKKSLLGKNKVLKNKINLYTYIEIGDKEGGMS